MIGAVLIAVVLFLFMRDLRTVLVSFVCIPLSLLTAVIVLDAMGWTINTMTLGGLAVALGVVVDDAVIDVENIVRRLRCTRRADARRRHACCDASLEVRAPVIYATLVVALVLAPVLMLDGLQGAFFSPLAASLHYRHPGLAGRGHRGHPAAVPAAARPAPACRTSPASSCGLRPGTSACWSAPAGRPVVAVVGAVLADHASPSPA